MLLPKWPKGGCHGDQKQATASLWPWCRLNAVCQDTDPEPDGVQILSSGLALWPFFACHHPSSISFRRLSDFAQALESHKSSLPQLVSKSDGVVCFSFCFCFFMHPGRLSGTLSKALSQREIIHNCSFIFLLFFVRVGWMPPSSFLIQQMPHGAGCSLISLSS